MAGSDGSIHLFRLGAEGILEIQLDGLVFPERVAFSPSGTVVAFYSRGSIEVVNGLPDKAGIAGGLDLRAGTNLDSMAISDDGNALLLAADGAVRLFGSFTELSRLMNAAGSVRMAFAPASHDAAIADPAHPERAPALLAANGK